MHAHADFVADENDLGIKRGQTRAKCFRFGDHIALVEHEIGDPKAEAINKNDAG